MPPARGSATVSLQHLGRYSEPTCKIILDLSQVAQQIDTQRAIVESLRSEYQHLNFLANQQREVIVNEAVEAVAKVAVSKLKSKNPIFNILKKKVLEDLELSQTDLLSKQLDLSHLLSDVFASDDVDVRAVAVYTSLRSHLQDYKASVTQLELARDHLTTTKHMMVEITEMVEMALVVARKPTAYASPNQPGGGGGAGEEVMREVEKAFVGMRERMELAVSLAPCLPPVPPTLLHLPSLLPPQTPPTQHLPLLHTHLTQTLPTHLTHLLDLLTRSHTFSLQSFLELDVRVNLERDMILCRRVDAFHDALVEFHVRRMGGPKLKSRGCELTPDPIPLLPRHHRNRETGKGKLAAESTQRQLLSTKLAEALNPAETWVVPI
ncbi:hypothetical protein BC829DRAFT_402129 [Chytridium lagenaria]|nr:hypothetical protein BC829DRAFT_402129 [Chytridium lagenaria]